MRHTWLGFCSSLLVIVATVVVLSADGSDQPKPNNSLSDSVLESWSSTPSIQLASTAPAESSVVATHAKLIEFRLPPDAVGAVSVAELHDRLTMEVRDERWADQTESEMRSYLDKAALSKAFSSPDPGRGFVINNIECRASICEILLTGHDSDMRKWLLLKRHMLGQPWAVDLSNATLRAGWNAEHHTLALVMVVMRKQEANKEIR